MAEERQTGQVSPKVYFRYVMAGGRRQLIILFPSFKHSHLVILKCCLLICFVLFF